MWIEMMDSVATAMEAFRGGEIYDQADVTARAWIARGLARPSVVPPPHVVEFFGRLERGAGGPVLFVPSVAEFGHRVLTGMRLIHWHKASRKVVCCRRGEEVLYPNADEYFADWTDPVDDAVRGGTGAALEWPEIEARYPGHVVVQTGNLTPAQETLCICPGLRVPLRPKRRGLRADVVFGIRVRAFCREKNWPAWQMVADAVTAAGYTFAVIGARPTTLDLDGQTHHSADYDTDAAVELLDNCKLYVGSDTGVSHLAAEIGARMLVFRQEWSRNRDLRGCMEERNPGWVESMPAGTWSDPDAVILRTLQILEAYGHD